MASVLLLVLAAVVVIVVALAISDVGHGYLSWLTATGTHLVNWAKGLVLDDLLALSRHLPRRGVPGPRARCGARLDLAEQPRPVGGPKANLRAGVRPTGQADRTERRLTDADRYALATGPLAVRGALDGKSVVLITTADAKPTDRDGVAALLRAAGASVTGELQLTDAFTDPTKSDQLRSLVTRLLPAGVQLPTAADPGTLAGGLIGPLLLLDKDTGKPQASPDETAAALTGLASGGYVRQGQGLHAAQLALVLTGGAVGGDSAADRAAVIARFATQVQHSGAGAVLAGVLLRQAAAARSACCARTRPTTRSCRVWTMLTRLLAGS